RLSCASAPEQASRIAINAETHSQISHDPCEIGDRQTAFLCGRKNRTTAADRPRERFATKQPGGELACPGAATRAKDATLPISGIGSAVPLRTRFGLQHLQHLSPSHLISSATKRRFRTEAFEAWRA